MADTQFQTPTLQTIVDRVSDDLNSRLPGEDSRIRRSFLYVLARVLAGASYSIYGFGRYIGKQVIWTTAEGTSLRRWASLFGLDPLPPAKASGTVTFSGMATTLIDSGTELRRDDGVLFTTTAGTAIGGGGTVSVALEAVEAGDDGNCDTSTTLTLTTPIAGVDNEATVDSPGLDGGRDAESDGDLRERFLEYVRNPPQGGAQADYAAWTRAAPALTATVDRVWVYGLPAGEVLVLFTLEGSGADVIPDAGDISAVEDYISEQNAEGHTIRLPVGVTLTVIAPTAQEVDLTITIHPDTVANRSSVQSELAEMFRREGEPGEDIKNSHILTAIGRVDDLDWWTLDSVDGGSGSADITADTDTSLPILGTITWGP